MMKNSSPQWLETDIWSLVFAMHSHCKDQWPFAFYHSHDGEGQKKAKYNWLLAAGEVSSFIVKNDESKNFFDSFKQWKDENEGWAFGVFSYELKDRLEVLKSDNKAAFEQEDIRFFAPAWVLGEDLSGKRFAWKHPSVKYWPDPELEVAAQDLSNPWEGIQFRKRFKKEDYLSAINTIKNYIIEGDIFEMNLCQEYQADQVNFNTAEAFRYLTSVNPSTFSGLLDFQERAIISSSPERFLCKRGKSLLSQPIKGTRRRGTNADEDEKLYLDLLNSEKDRSENVMIVDLVRNDLSRSATKGSVKVDELMHVYPFASVFQMISTVSSSLRDDVHPVDALKYAYPMGSMTGAPKVRAMEIIDECENFKRGWFSGSIGYFEPGGDFDFNVLIRSFYFDRDQKKLTYASGGAITIRSEAEEEYEESLLKAKIIITLSGNQILDPLDD